MYSSSQFRFSAFQVLVSCYGGHRFKAFFKKNNFLPSFLAVWVSEASCAFPWLGLAEALVLRLGTSPPAEQKLPATWAQELRLPGFSAEPVPRPCPGLCDPWSVAHQAPLSTGPSRQEYRVGSLARLQGVFLTQLSRTAGGFFPV